MDEVWHDRAPGGDVSRRTVDTDVRRLRAKLGPVLMCTIWQRASASEARDLQGRRQRAHRLADSLRRVAGVGAPPAGGDVRRAGPVRLVEHLGRQNPVLL